MAIGERLPSSPGVETYALSLREDPHEEDAEHDSGHAHSGGSVAAYLSSEAAVAELTNCERSAAASGELFCLQVENVLVILGGEISPAEAERLSQASAALVG